MAGLLVGLLGRRDAASGSTSAPSDSAALAEILVVVVGYAVAPVIMARRLADLPSIPVVSASLLIVALGYLPYAVLRWPSGVTGQQVAAVATLGVVCTALAFILFFALIAAIGPARAVVITYVNPAVAVLFGVTTLGEDFTLGMAIGFPLILLGSVLAARRRVPPGRRGARGGGVRVRSAADQSMRTSPDAVSKTAASTPVPVLAGVAPVDLDAVQAADARASRDRSRCARGRPRSRAGAAAPSSRPRTGARRPGRPSGRRTAVARSIATSLTPICCQRRSTPSGRRRWPGAAGRASRSSTGAMSSTRTTQVSQPPPSSTRARTARPNGARSTAGWSRTSTTSR